MSVKFMLFAILGWVLCLCVCWLEASRAPKKENGCPLDISQERCPYGWYLPREMSLGEPVPYEKASEENKNTGPDELL